MKTTKLHKLMAVILALALAFSVAAPIAGSAAEAKWTVKDDTQIFWVKTDDSDINDETLKTQIQLFSSELAEKTETAALPITFGEADEVGTNDIILVLDNTLEIAAQGYTVSASDSCIKINASDADGLFYGCRYLIKQLVLNGSVGSVADAPDVLERAVSLDNGRKYYSVEWIKEFIREMSWANMNALALHFSEEMGLGIESKLYPWLNGRDGTLCTQADIGEDYDDRYLTQEEVKEIVEYAKLYHIEIIPSLDSPGHMNYIVKKFNEQCATEPFSFEYDGEIYTAEAGYNIGNYFSYNGKETAVVPGSRNGNYSRGIDISDEIAVAFTKSLIEEYATLFGELGCTKFDIGGDELLGWGSAVVSTSTASRWQQLDHWKAYAIEKTGNENAVAYDAFLLYMNDLYDLVTSLGYKSVRMWNDDALRSHDTGWTGVVQLNTNIDIWFWTTGSNIFYDYANAGYQLYNIIGDYNYYAMTDDYFRTDGKDTNGDGDYRDSFIKADPELIYNEWTPFIFYPADLNADWKHNPGVTNPNVLGGAFGVWCDNPTLKTEDEVMTDLLPLIRANAAKSWDVAANETVNFDTFTANWANIGSAPAGTVAAPKVGTTADPTALNEAIAAYELADASLYTGDSFAAYTAAVGAAKKLLATGTYSQAEVDAALTEINAAVAALVLLPENAVECILSGTARSNRVYNGKSQTLSISVDKNIETTGLKVFDENGNEVQATKCAVNTRKSDRNVYSFLFKVNASSGMRTYTVYVVLADGSLSADFIQFSFEVR